MRGFLEKTNYPLPTYPKVYTSNGAKQLGCKEVLKLDGCLDPLLQSNFSP
jgi:hypothetical protein